MAPPLAMARRLDGAFLAVAALVPAGLAAAHAVNVADASRDEGVVRVLGLEPRVWRGLDTLVGLLFQVAPVGTRAARAALGGALGAAASGAVLYVLVRALLQGCAPTRRLGPAVATIAALLPLVGGPWQIECSTVGGSATGALLVLLPICLLARSGAADPPEPPLPDLGRALHGSAFALGLAAGYEPSVGACALAGVCAFALVDPRLRRAIAASGRHAISLGSSFAAGLAPWALCVARARASGASFARLLGAGWSSEGLVPSAHAPAAMIASELGTPLLLFAAAGLALTAVAVRARPLAAALVGVALVGYASSRVQPSGPSHYASTSLAVLAAVCALAGAGMQALVRLVASARVPMARASAAMVLLFEMVFPVDAADEARPARGQAVAAWDDAAFGELPPATVVVVSSDFAWQRAAAARSRGSLRGDVTVVAGIAGSLAGAVAVRRALASDPALLPLWRDLELTGAPSEASLTAVAAVRPLSTAYEPRWGRVLGGHLVPEGLFDRFELEPRGASDRRAGLAAFAPVRESLARAAHDDPEVAAGSARLLRARALLFATLDVRDPDAVAQAVADVRAFAPRDPVAAQIVARLASKGPAHFDDLEP